MNNTRNDCPWLEAPVVPTAAPEPFEFPLTADPYSIINIYARQRQRGRDAEPPPPQQFYRPPLNSSTPGKLLKWQ